MPKRIKLVTLLSGARTSPAQSAVIVASHETPVGVQLGAAKIPGSESIHTQTWTISVSTLALAGGLLLVPAEPARATVTYDTIALSGAAGTALGLGPNLGTGVDFSSGFVGGPALNAAGEIAFVGRAAGTGIGTANDYGIWSNVGGTLAVVAREGSEGPGPDVGDGVVFGRSTSTSLGVPNINAAGEVAFSGFLTGSGVSTSNDRGLWSTAGGTLAAVARTGTGGPGPNVGSGVNFGSFGSAVLNDAGELAFSSMLSGSVSSSNDNGIWSNVGGTLAVVAREGSHAPNMDAGVNFSHAYDPALNAAGTVAFHGNLIGAGVDATNNDGIWTISGGTPTLVARKGSDGPGPNLGPGVSFSQFSYVRVALNGAGEVAFHGIVAGAGVDDTNERGIWSNAGGTLAVVAREGSDGPGPNAGAGIQFSDFENPVINAAGEVAFAAWLTGTGIDASNNRGVWTSVGGTPTMVAQTGSDVQGPNLGPGITFSGFNAIQMNAAGEVAFLGIVTGAGVGSNDQGIWTNAGGVLQKVVREGDLFDVDPGVGIDLRTISFIEFSGSSGGEDGQRMLFNDSGLLTFRLGFTDNSGGIFTALVPEPGSMALLALGGLLGLRRGRSISTRYEEPR